MAMDVIGLNPTEIEGRHFRRNIVCWHHMWDVIANVYPELAKKIKYPYSNDGDGLNSEDSILLSELIGDDLALEHNNLSNYIYTNLSQKNISVPDLTDFSDLVFFLQDCGGFEIW